MKANLTTIGQYIWVLFAVALSAILAVWITFRAQRADYQVVAVVIATVFVTWSWNYWKNNDEQDKQGDIIQDMIARDQAKQFNATRAELATAIAANNKLAKQLRATQEQLAQTADQLLITEALAGAILAGNIKHLSTVKGQGHAPHHN